MELYPKIIDNKAEHPLAIYSERYLNADFEAMAARCGLQIDRDAGILRVPFLGDTVEVSFPTFSVRHPELDGSERILILRYLLEGRFVPGSGKYMAYREFNWGGVYEKQFDGRCIKRFAYSYGNKPELLKEIMSRMPARPIEKSDLGFDVTLFDGFIMRFLLWLGDEEFPPSAQILFSDNFAVAFSAEDMAVAGDIVLNRMKAISTRLSTAK